MDCTDLDPDAHAVLRVATRAGVTKRGKSRSTKSHLCAELNLRHRDLIALLADLEATGHVLSDSDGHLWIHSGCTCDHRALGLDVEGGSAVHPAPGHARPPRSRSRTTPPPPLRGERRSTTFAPTDGYPSVSSTQDSGFPNEIRGPRGKRKKREVVRGHETPSQLADRFVREMRRFKNRTATPWLGEAANVPALRRHFNAMRRAGVDAGTIAAMIELFFSSEGYLRRGTPPWRGFIAQREALLQAVVTEREANLLAQGDGGWLGSPPTGAQGDERVEW